MKKEKCKLSLRLMKNHDLKYRASRRIEAFRKMCAMVLVWVCKMVCKDNPVLMADNSIGQSGKIYAMAAMMPFAMMPVDDTPLFAYALAHKSVNSSYSLTASNDDTFIIGKDPYTSDQQRARDQYEINDTDWNEVNFTEVNGSSTCKLALHKDWITNHGYYVDGIVNMNLPEQGISGPFRITSIKHIIPQKKPVDENENDEWEYRPVTGLFTHHSNDIWKITFDNGEVLGVTNNHPIYSVSKGDWQHAGHLEIGEEVLAKSGNTKVVSKERDFNIQPVYNLEIKDLHNFLVNESGVVVHNTGLCDFLKSLYAKYSKWYKTHPDSWLDEANVQDIMQKMLDNDPFVFNQPIYTTTYKGKTYLIDGHNRLKAAKNLKAQGYDIELHHNDVDPAHISSIPTCPYKDINDLLKNVYNPNE
ncbi:MAG TPA: polymorphic toxin-type HINT domain-containing protein [Saprospiraceae bacterium]|nr:polymorphic toxin-type HINT domain-containing protein [Saprospiraceae bacterium]